MLQAYFLCFMFQLFQTADHAIYLSVVELTCSEDGQEATVNIKVFTDDLNDVLKNYEEEKKKKSKEPPKDRVDLLNEYFSRNLRLVVNGSYPKLRLALQEESEEADATYLTFSAANVEAWESIEIYAPFFTELFAGQTNVFSVFYNDQQYHAKTSKGLVNATIRLD